MKNQESNKAPIQESGAPEACHIPAGDTQTSASVSAVDKIREEFGIPSSINKGGAAPEACHIPAGSSQTPASVSAVDKIKEEFGIPSSINKGGAAPEACHIPEGSSQTSASVSAVDKIREEFGIPSSINKGGAAPEACHIPEGSSQTSASVSAVDEIRREFEIPSSIKQSQTDPNACHIPAGSSQTSASVSAVDEIRKEFGIPSSIKQSQTDPNACHIPAGSTQKAANAEEVEKIKEKFKIPELKILCSHGCAPKGSHLYKPDQKTAETIKSSVAQNKENNHHVISAEEFLISLGYRNANPMRITYTENESKLDTLSAEESRAILNHLASDIPKEAKIIVVKNGPLLVFGSVPLRESRITTNAEHQSVGWEKSKAYDVGDQYALCRCGQTKNPPFCDGSHVHCGLDLTCTAENIPYIEAAHIYDAADGCYLLDQENLCAILRYCDPDTSCWNLVQSSEGLPEAVIQTMSCASGRLTVLKDGKLIEPELEQEIELIDDYPRRRIGPLYVKAYIPVSTQEGVDYEPRNRQTLCRCGHSKNKPFCDGEHLREGSID